MADFSSILKQISTAGQIVQAAESGIVEFSDDHIKGTQELLQIAGAGVAAETGDAEIANEAMVSAQLASTLVPLGFQLFSLIKSQIDAAKAKKAAKV